MRPSGESLEVVRCKMDGVSTAPSRPSDRPPGPRLCGLPGKGAAVFTTDGKMMDEPNPFAELYLQVQAGNQDVAAQLVQRYEPVIRRIVRLRLANTPLVGLVESADVCQSVLASFFLRAALGQYTLNSFEKLGKLLAVMARSKLAAQLRHHQAQRRDRRRVTSTDGAEPAAAGAPPSRHAAAKELLQEARRRLSAEEGLLAELRAEGQDWATIAARVGGSPEALRKKLARALDRVSQELGLDEP
jgi:RNA polymerase sigma factor (sigma-70 family)